MHNFYDRVNADGTRIIAGDYFQELFLQLHLLGLYDTPVLGPSWKSNTTLGGDMTIFSG
jgi:hypothetical protein